MIFRQMNNLILLVVVLSLIASTSCFAESPTLNVRDFGAQGDGVKKDTAAIQKALDVCAAGGGGTVWVPAGQYLTGSLVLPANIALKLDVRATLTGSPDLTDYPLVNVRWEGEFCPGHRALISATDATNIAISGGTIVGPPLALSKLRNPRGPVLIELTGCTNVLLDGFTTKFQQLWSIHTLFCNALIGRNLNIQSEYANGDGIDVDSCDGVTIEHCEIHAGDDAIALKSGRGLAAQNLLRPTQNVVIRDCHLESSLFAALGLGSEMSGGIRNVKIQNCVIAGRQNAIFIKSREGRGGFIENISGENIAVLESPTFIGIDLINKGIQAHDPVPGDVDKWPLVQNIRFKNIQVQNVAKLVVGTNIPATRALKGFMLANITGTCSHAISIANMTDVDFSHIGVSGFVGSLVSATNVQGGGLDDSARN